MDATRPSSRYVRPRHAIATAALLALAGCQGEATMGLQRDDTPRMNPPGMTPVTPPGMTPPGMMDPTPPTPPPPFAPGESVLPRLTQVQYQNALRDILGGGLPATALEADTNPYLFYSIGASTTEISGFGVERYAESAYEIASTVFGDPMRAQAFVGCVPGNADDACTSGFISRLGQRMFRRPMASGDVARWVGVARDTQEPGEPFSGLEMVLAGMLQSPKFLYFVQLGEPDGEDRRFTSYEMAERLASLLWNTVPDENLLELAAQDALVDDARLREIALEMLEDPRARDAIQDFFAQYLDLVRLDHVERDPARYPGFTPSLVSAMRTEVKLLVDDVVFRQDADIRTLFTTRRSFLNSELAALYEVDVPGAVPYVFEPVEFPQGSPRAGLLTLGAFLTMNAHPTETSPTLRGKYLRERLFCQVVPAPPDDIDLNLAAEPGEPETLRERLEQHRDDPACSGCHAFIDPPGYLFENFDSVGRYRTEAEGHPVDATGELNGVALENATGLAGILRKDEVMPACLVRQLYRHAQGRLEIRSETAAIEDLQMKFAMSGYRFQDLLVELVMSQGFRRVAATQDGGQ